MDILTFGQVILFKDSYYVWLVLDEEEKKIHLAKILDRQKTKELIKVDENNAKKSKYSLDAPLFAYVVLTTEKFNECAAHLYGSDNHTEDSDGLSVFGTLNDKDIGDLKKFILSGKGLPSRLVNLVKGLG